MVCGVVVVKGNGGVGEAPAELRPKVVGEGVGEGRRWCWGAGWERKGRGGWNHLTGSMGKKRGAAAGARNPIGFGDGRARRGVGAGDDEDGRRRRGAGSGDVCGHAWLDNGGRRRKGARWWRGGSGEACRIEGDVGGGGAGEDDGESTNKVVGRNCGSIFPLSSRIDPERAFSISVIFGPYAARHLDGSTKRFECQSFEWIVDSSRYTPEKFSQQLGERIIWGSCQDVQLCPNLPNAAVTSNPAHNANEAYTEELQEDAVRAKIPVDDINPEERHCLYDRDRPRMVVGCTFPTMKDFRMAIRQYAINEEFDLDIGKSDPTRFRGSCKDRAVGITRKEPNVGAKELHGWMQTIPEHYNIEWHLKRAIGEPPLLALCSDASKGLENEVKEVSPHCEQRECFRHLMQFFINKFYGNVFANMYLVARAYRQEVLEYADALKIAVSIHLKWKPDCRCDPSYRPKYQLTL
uniref:PH01B035L11.12 protein n=1 Tax=Phyllostachys edulis TaxID=38705 RepID=L0P2I3_PHYED|nr:PH01B035L11.12 [Phyllostachys edulis]